MTIEQFVRLRYMLVIPAIPFPFLVAAKQKDCLLLRVEREKDTHMPNTQLFHIGVARHFDMVDERTPKRRARPDEGYEPPPRFALVHRQSNPQTSYRTALSNQLPTPYRMIMHDLQRQAQPHG
jgi:hypothetical protein